jgi:hypothetical protein
MLSLAFLRLRERRGQRDRDRRGERAARARRRLRAVQFLATAVMAGRELAILAAGGQFAPPHDPSWGGPGLRRVARQATQPAMLLSFPRPPLCPSPRGASSGSRRFSPWTYWRRPRRKKGAATASCIWRSASPPRRRRARRARPPGRRSTGAIGYTEALGIAPLRERIAQHYKQAYGVAVSPERVVVTTGSSAGFVLAFLALFDAGPARGDHRAGLPGLPQHPGRARSRGSRDPARGRPTAGP